MKEKVKSFLGTTKKGVVFTAAVAVLVVGAGAGAVYAASNPSKFVEVAQNQDGSFRYTKDNGKTWKDGLPEEAKTTKNADGSQSVSIADPNYSESDFGPGVSIRTDANGKNEEYSTDGGKTWSSKAPEGVQFQELDGKKSASNVLQIKQKDNGTFQFSTDGGKTWKDGLPKEAKTTKNADGSQSVSIADPNYSKGDFGPGVSIRSDANGKNEEYSTDGGKTWSNKAPAGVQFQELDGKQFSSHVQLQIKQKDDGSFQFSTDGGKTWKNGLPEVTKTAKNADGSQSVSTADPNYSKDDFGPGVSIRTDANGKNEEYSTDGGKTWSKKAPAGVQFQELK
ncbi:hypothetical protein ACFQZR_10220 [Paenibacillus sp. GCM10027629]|uniref:hypothetical protein n=1 Tax=Paenibacillus sp. GCM10027629 TaxID=3273414 RepID=UPI0036410FB9